MYAYIIEMLLAMYVSCMGVPDLFLLVFYCNMHVCIIPHICMSVCILNISNFYFKTRASTQENTGFSTLIKKCVPFSIRESLFVLYWFEDTESINSDVEMGVFYLF